MCELNDHLLLLNYSESYALPDPTPDPTPIDSGSLQGRPAVIPTGTVQRMTDFLVEFLVTTYGHTIRRVRVCTVQVLVPCAR